MRCSTVFLKGSNELSPDQQSSRCVIPTYENHSVATLANDGQILSFHTRVSMKVFRRFVFYYIERVDNLFTIFPTINEWGTIEANWITKIDDKNKVDGISTQATLEI